MRWVWLVLGTGGALAAAYGLLAGGDDAVALRYTTTRVERGPITATVTATGTVNPVAAVIVGTYVSGPVQEVFVDYNAPIHKGQLLARIDPRPFQTKVDAAEADLATAHARVDKSRADLALRQATFRRQRALATDGVASQNDLDVSQSDARQAEAQLALEEASLRQAEAHLEEARVNLAYTDIVSPIDGIIVARNVDVGQTVAASFQTPTLFQVAGDLTRMAVDASVSESDIGQVTEGQTASFTVDAYPGEPFHGTITQVRNAPLTVQNVVTYGVIIAVPNTDLRLKPGMTANVTITTADRADALRVPVAALRFKPPGGAPANGGAGVWRPGAQGTPERVAVTTGVTDDSYTEILSGLAAGDTVITGFEREPSPVAPGPTRGPAFAPGGRRGH